MLQPSMLLIGQARAILWLAPRFLSMRKVLPAVFRLWSMLYGRENRKSLKAKKPQTRLFKLLSVINLVVRFGQGLDAACTKHAANFFVAFHQRDALQIRTKFTFCCNE